MAEGLNSAALHVGGAAIAAAITYLSLHSATPDASGSNETSASREAVTASDTAGVISVGSTSFSGGAASGDCKFVGYWSASTGGTFYGYQALDGDQSFNAAGEYDLDAVTLTGSAS